MELVPLDRALMRFVLSLSRDAVDAKHIMPFPEVYFPGCAYAVHVAGRFIAAGGVIPIWPGRAEGWLLITHLAEKREIVTGIRFAGRWLDAKQEDPAFGRIEFFLLSQAAWRESFARALGLRFLSDLKRWGPDGEDYCHYERLRF